MRILSITLAALIIVLSNCKKDSEVKGFYDHVHFAHQGSGEIDFNVYSTDSMNSLKVVVNKYNFRDTTIEIILENDKDNATSFSMFNKTVNSQVRIDGNFSQSSLLTGVWINIYAVNGKETEVTNVDLRKALLNFEQLVRNKIL